jgi:SHS2 domain-containing protein
MVQIDQGDFRIFDHTADLGMEIYGDDAAALFTNAARALFQSLVSIGDEPPAESCREAIDVTGADWPDLMVNWLRELLYLWNGRQKILIDLHIEFLSQTAVCAQVTAGDFDPRRHIVDQEIKAVTYHQIEAGPHGGRWRARVIFDI